MSQELKPCPFCRSTTALNIMTAKDYYEGILQYCCNSGDFTPPGDGYFINCNFIEGGCGAVSGWEENEAKVIVKWNTRVLNQTL